MNNNHGTSEWLDNGLGNIFIIITSWSVFIACLLCLLWGLFGGVSIFPKPPSMIANHFKFCGCWKDQQLKAIALHQDLYSPIQVEGFLRGIQTTQINDDGDNPKYATQAIVHLQGITVGINIPKEQEFELKVGKPVQLYYYRHLNAYGWEPIGRWKYYRDIWTARIALIVGSLLLIVLFGFLLFKGCKAVFLDIPQWISAHENPKPKRK